MKVKPDTSHATTVGVKHNLSERSSPKKVVKRKKSGNPVPTRSSNDALADTQMTIVPENYPKSSISQDQVGLIRNSILQELDMLEIKGPEPKFSEYRHHEVC